MDLIFKKGKLLAFEICCEFMGKAIAGDEERIYRIDLTIPPIGVVFVRFPKSTPIKYCPWCGKIIKVKERK